MEEEKSLFYNELAIASFTIGVTSFIQLIGLEKSITAIVFGVLAYRRIKQDNSQQGKKLAIIGIVLGVIYTAVIVLILPQAIEIMRSMLKTVQ